MNVQEIFSKMRSGEVKAHSELGTRDESKQTRNYGTRYQKLKLTTGINGRALVMKDVVLKFNPITCEPDDEYNEKTPFRPILLVSQTLEYIVSLCKESPETAEAWKNRIDIDLTADDLDLFEVYRRFKACNFIQTRITTYHTVALNFGGIQGFPQFKTKYTVDSSQLNEEGSYDFNNAPPWHLAASFFYGLIRPEWDEKRKLLESKGSSKEIISAEKSAVYAKSPVGPVMPTNLVSFFYFPFNSELKKYDPKDPKGVEETIRFMSYTNKWMVPLSEVKEQELFDTDIDFYDFHIKTPSSRDVKPSGEVFTDNDGVELYEAMQITNTDSRVALHGGKTSINGKLVENETLYADFITTVKEYFLMSQMESAKENGDSFEKIMAMSNRFRPITTAMDNFLVACNEVFASHFADSKFLSDKFIQGHHAFYTMMNPANSLALAEFDEEELEDAARETKVEVDAIIADVKQSSEEDADPTLLNFAEE